MKNLCLKILPLVALFPFMASGQWTVNGSNIYNNNTGNIGIGTTSPETKLHVNGVIKSSFLILSENSTTLGYFGRGLPTTGAWNQTPDVLALTYMGRDFAIGGWSKSTAVWKGAAFYINSDDGNVGIGTTAPKEKLSVNGKIRAHEIKVETSGWPDYVFAKDYQLPSLQETEQHIKDKGHLPGIPSAEEVKANGVDLGEMNAKLLKKIEELTLHLIESEKHEKKQQAEINELREMMTRLLVKDKK
ncbi:hypothetical protein [Pedobacter sp. B4-66]|uniref:hypothetical protein n=1 Tax=Pedobacter sp. B4-66 TaxID=2817280 RepID=UPI001BDB1F5C|nr:hypothetical protein [Pedobacter sp. B4-66]